MENDTRKPIVFVLDDDDSVRRSLGRLIRAEGYEARLYESPERFLDEVTAETAGCLVLDIAMPRVGGLDVQARLNERGIGMPVIVVTARDDDATRREARRGGAKFFFRKPVDERTLIDAIDWAANSEGERSAP